MRVLFLIFGLSLFSVSNAGPYDTDIEMNRLKPVDPAVLVSQLPDKSMTASHVKVGHVSDGQPLLCFKDPDKQLIGCFVLNIKTDQVVFVQLPTDESSL